jgi:prepilin-type N-terminal cleavage/methylation domain-containing protein
MLILATIRRRAGDSRGFSLIEVLVAMVTGLIVTGALFAILEVSLRQTTRDLDTVQATQLGGAGLTHIVDELHSACLASKFTPILEKSSPTELRFISGYSQAAEIGKGEVHEHHIVWEPKNDTLTDFSYSATSGEAPSFTYAKEPEPKAGTRIAEDVIEVEKLPKTEPATFLPMFRYEKYATKPVEATSSTSVSGLTPIEYPSKSPEPLTAAMAKEVSSVAVEYRAGPVNGDGREHRTVVFESQVAFAFASPLAETEIKAGPCE